MAIVEFIMPKMGESIFEATILKWLKNEGDSLEKDESLLEIATDKVDTEVPSMHAGIITKILVKEGAIVKIGSPLALISTNTDSDSTITHPEHNTIHNQEFQIQETKSYKPVSTVNTSHTRFYSPLVLNIAKNENISISELDDILGTGKDERVTKDDILAFIKTKKTPAPQHQITTQIPPKRSTHKEPVQEILNAHTPTPEVSSPVLPAPSISGAHDIVEMDRMRKIIAQRMIDSRKISAHVTSFVEADVTNMVAWRSKIKHDFMRREGEGITFTPVFIACICKALKDYPMINTSVSGDNIIVKKYINIGIAVALPSGNLIVPVLKNADRYNITGLTKEYNQLIKKAKEGKLSADDLQDGTYTISNVGGFGNVMGTPIIVQPQVAIMAFGSINKKPAVIESEKGDTIGIRHLMFLSHSYDHRIIDGALGGMFVRKVADYLENFDVNQTF
ncbi:MAG: dihydrolipoamide acetyltransferase family protein [Cytophagales bacterium]|nr:dihydrolipoamide acetyltransferase family protein [Cytophagales bacterium]